MQSGTMSGNLELTNKQILLPGLKNTFFHPMLALEVKKYVPFCIVHCSGSPPDTIPNGKYDAPRDVCRQKIILSAS